MHAAFQRTEHRPWPVPATAWAWRQNWKDLLFAHWPIASDAIRPLVPEGLDVQEFGGTSWIGVVPFRMTGVMRRPFPDLPWVSAFPELNVRVYVERDGKPGVWFLSLDAANALAVWGARRWFHLPYHLADMEFRREGDGFALTSRRRSAVPSVGFRSEYRGESEVFEARPGTLEHWLTERYCLYARSDDGVLYRGHVHHVPWPLQHATAQLEADALLAPFSLAVAGAPHLLFSRGVDVVVWPLERIG